MAVDKLQFKISSALKDILGRDLITDDFIAVFELVKNSFDAHATDVEIIFEEDSITIIDNGKGMSYKDLKSKWLFVAYSAKHDGTEDIYLEEGEYLDYRDKIQDHRSFAGSKGIGRFSCDRLGEKLTLFTKKAMKISVLEKLIINWSDFEIDSNDEFTNIQVFHESSPDDNFRSLKNGTILKIVNLRASWDRKKIRNLKKSLEKLINPISQDLNDTFRIKITAKKEIKHDLLAESERDKVNGYIKNILFDELNLKTTHVTMEIDEKGEYIKTSLTDRGINIYEITENNKTSPKLKNIKYQLFYLNRSAKMRFKNVMGIRTVDYGSIFLYKNGFRVYPFGEEGKDLLRIDRRKQQGYSRYLGTRELIGRIEIVDHQEIYRETSSRDGGLIETDHYMELIKQFNICLRRLENYVVDIQWQIEKDHYKEYLSIDDLGISEGIISIISKLAKTSNIIDFKYNKNLFEIIKQKIADANPEVFTDLLSIAANLKDDKLQKELRVTERKFAKILNERIQAERKTIEERELRLKAEKEQIKIQEELEIEKQKNTFLLSTKRGVSKDAQGLIHAIKLSSTRINSAIQILLSKINSNSLKQKELQKRLINIKLNSDKVLKISKIVTRANFAQEKAKQVVDVVKYIEQYMKIYSNIYEDINVEFEINSFDSTLIKKISILELSIVLDNLISNSEKANAKKIRIDMINSSDNRLVIKFSDNGLGVLKKYLNNKEELFELGVTTTYGSGIGLVTVKDILKGMKGTIKFVGNGVILDGATFEILI